MAIGSGLGSTLGVKKESTYGTYVAPTEFFEFDSESLAFQPAFLSSSGLRGGRLGRPIGRHRQTTKSAGGSITLKVPNKGFGRFLNMLHGNTVTPVQQGATTAYKQTHNIGTNGPYGKSITVQVNRPSTTPPADNAFSYLGCKVTNITFSCDLSGDLMATIDLDARDEDTAQTYATPSYSTGISSFDFTQAAVTVNGGSVGLLRSFNLSVPVPLATDRFGLGSASKSEPLVNDYMLPTCSLTAEFADTTGYNLFKNGTSPVPVVVDFVGATIASTYHEEIKFTLAGCKVTGTTPQVGGPDLVTIDLPSEVYDDGTNPLVAIDYVSTDVAAL